MARVEVSCGCCQSPVWRPLDELDARTRCGSCGGEVEVHAFPALWEDRSQTAAEAVLLEGESCCFYHAEKRATVVCEGCGRFLCGLCDIAWEGRNFCPACVEASNANTKEKTFQPSHTYMDSILLSASIMGFLIFQLALVTAPMVLILAIVNMRKRMSVLPRGRWRLVLACLFSVLQIVLWAFFIIGLMTAATWEEGV